MARGEPILILSVDGGGARGVLPVNILYRLQTHSDIAVRESFDFFAGVSTGALVAAYCAAGAGPLELLVRQSYSSQNMSEIFDKSLWDRVFGRVQHVPKYDGRNKRAYLSAIFDGACINDIRDKHLLVLAYDFINRELIVYKNRRGHDARHNPPLEEVCDAATAAPTLYPAVPTSEPDRRWLVDGALATNDPSLCAITESLSMGYAIDEIHMLSIGTGRPAHDLSQRQRARIGEASREWGLYGWVRNGLLEHMLSASSTVSAHQCRQLLGERYLRVDGTLPRALMRLDETSPEYVRNLEAYAQRWYEEYRAPIIDLVARVQALRPAVA